ncbi:YbgC/FadM family acyl-CoA thioesterase [Helicobacter sp. NHP22-001]|uniref:YbgC/FadM family acyl-CoA thioesterase n=1 Tax=Helicobacter sp. NHP22-001 TaxID=3040202 RepID=UPI00244D92FA|nr:YbgC/FadM family acyl-CoA thioesterase [Helicobacter sp. NHP22-001]GMB96477.1 Thioesterase family protein YbgC [Helicobacter sp. NHP22-001]
MQFRVYYEDTDSTGLVYHANYLKFCERARSEVFFKVGVVPQSTQGGFVIKSLQAEFITPALLGDCLQVSTQILELKRVSLSLQQEILRQEQRLFRMRIKLAFIDLATKKPTSIPQKFLEILHGF